MVSTFYHGTQTDWAVGGPSTPTWTGELGQFRRGRPAGSPGRADRERVRAIVWPACPCLAWKGGRRRVQLTARSVRRGIEPFRKVRLNRTSGKGSIRFDWFDSPPFHVSHGKAEWDRRFDSAVGVIEPSVPFLRMGPRFDSHGRPARGEEKECWIIP